MASSDSLFARTTLRLDLPAALQLERARQAERDKKRQQLIQQEEATKKANEDAEMTEAAKQEVDDNDNEESGDPKRNQALIHEHLGRSGRSAQHTQGGRVTQVRQQVDVSMNLSESSSSSSSEEDD